MNTSSNCPHDHNNDGDCHIHPKGCPQRTALELAEETVSRLGVISRGLFQTQRDDLAVAKRLIAVEALYRDLLHAAWHALDNAEEHDDGSCTIDSSAYERLDQLLPEDHPV